MSTLMYETNSWQETYELGKEMAMKAVKGDIICLDGDLGVGKTVFTQGFAKGLGIEENVNSPTFTIMQVYDEHCKNGNLPLYHFDVYRIGDISEMDEIGYEEYFYGEGVCLIEWSSIIDELLPKEVTRITIQKDTTKGFDYRKVVVNS